MNNENRVLFVRSRPVLGIAHADLGTNLFCRRVTAGGDSFAGCHIAEEPSNVPARRLNFRDPGWFE